MSSSKMAWRAMSWPILAIGLTAPWITNCGAMPGVPNVPGSPMGGGECPDTSSAEAVEKFDFVGGFKLDAATAGKLKGGLAASVDLKNFASSVDADLKTACGGLATDLGEGGTFNNGQDACKAAIKAMGDVKAKMGANVKIVVEMKPPECRASMDAYADCAGHCDVNAKPGSVKVECEPGHLSGDCSGSCSGSCDMSAAAKCTEKCSGSCDANMKGSCGGNCNGKCDGKSSSGTCAGQCEGKCDAHIEGQCSGSCSGNCSMKAQATCSGKCNGSCSVEMKAPSCTGEMKPPQISADCKAHCDAKVQAKAECSPAEVGIKIEGSADATASITYKKALEKNLPLILKTAIGVGERGMKMADNVAASVSGIAGSVKGAVGGGPLMAAKLMGCISGPFKDAADAAGSLKANVSVSVDVKASASAGGSAHSG